jgi:hypothetical protein
VKEDAMNAVEAAYMQGYQGREIAERTSFEEVDAWLLGRRDFEDLRDRWFGGWTARRARPVISEFSE